MKKIILILSAFLFFLSCKSNEEIINFISKQDNKPENKILITSNVVSNKTVLNVLKNYSHAQKEIFDSNFNFTKKLYDSITNKLLNDTISRNWKKKQFEEVDGIIVNTNLMYLKSNNIYYKKYFSGNYSLYSISKPTIINNLLLFYISKNRSLGSVEYSKVVIMEKKKNKWVNVVNVYSTELF